VQHTKNPIRDHERVPSVPGKCHPTQRAFFVSVPAPGVVCPTFFCSSGSAFLLPRQSSFFGTMGSNLYWTMRCLLRDAGHSRIGSRGQVKVCDRAPAILGAASIGSRLPNNGSDRLRLFLDRVGGQLKYRSPLPGSEVSDKNDCTVWEFRRVVMLVRFVGVNLAKPC
jgi:hypothetical protein